MAGIGWSLDGRMQADVYTDKMGGHLGPVPDIWFILVNTVHFVM